MSSSGGQFLGNTIILFVGRICTKLIQFFLLPLYTAILSTSEYGTVDLITAYVTILVVIVNLQLDNAIYRFLVEHRKNQEKTEDVISNVISICLKQVFVFSIMYFIVQFFITIDAKIFLLLNVISSIFMTTMLQITRGLGDYKTYAKASFISAFLTISLNILFLVIFHLSVFGLLLSTFLSYLITGMYIFFKKKIYFYIKKSYINKKTSKELLKYSIPLIPNELSWQAIRSSDKFLVSYILGASYNGILSVSTKFSSVYTEMYNIFNASLTDTVITNLKDKNNYQFIDNLINRLYILFLSIAILIIGFMPFIFNIFINKAFNEAYYYIPLNIIASLINVVIGLFSGILVAEKNTKVIASTSVTAGIINIIVDIIMLKYVGLYAAAISTILGFLTMFITRYILITKKYPIRIHLNNFILSVVLIIPTLLVYYFGNIFLKLITILIIIIVVLYINFDTIMKLKKYGITYLKKIKNQRKTVK